MYPLLRERRRPSANTKYASADEETPIFWSELDGVAFIEGRRKTETALADAVAQRELPLAEETMML
jgi:hypothetical protein